MPPTGRFINLVITAGRDGQINVYVDGARIGGGTLPDLGINGCAPAELRFGADQGGGQRISAELDRTAMFTKVLSATDRGRWQSLAFVNAVETPVEIGGTVPTVLALNVAGAASLGTFLPGVTNDYTSSVSATVTTTAATAALSVHDPSTNSPGHLVNGSYVMPQPLQVNVATGAFAPIDERAAPAADLQRPAHERPGRDRLQAAGRGHGRPALRRLRQIADVHALDHDAVSQSHQEGK